MARKKKYQPPRSRRKAKAGARRSGTVGWSLLVGTIVVLGIAGIVLSRGDRPEAGATEGPRIGDHFHAAFGVNVCGQWMPDAPEFPSDLHTHSDGLIHAHPNATTAAGSRATFENFLSRGGWSVSADRLDLWFDEIDVDETQCDGEQAVLRWALNGEEQEGDVGDYVVEDGDQLVVAVIPADAELPTQPPSAPQLQAPVDLPPPTGGTTATTAAGGGGDTTGAGDTDTTAADTSEADGR